MVFLLESNNIFQYLIQNRISGVREGQKLELIEEKCGKNFNLLVHFSEHHPLLIKQEPHDQQGQTNGDFQNEWKVYELVRKFPELNHLCQSISEAIYFDPVHSILVFNYLTDYSDLEEFYRQHQLFSTACASALGFTLAQVHQATLDQRDYKTFLEGEGDKAIELPDFGQELEQIFPESFGTISADGLKFYELYQRDESLKKAIAHLNTVYEPCCLTHNDLKFNNVLLKIDWEKSLSSGEQGNPIRLIDWEKGTWGEPALDVGTIIASYLKLWLKSLPVSRDIEIELSLRLATTPLEKLQPSLIAFLRAYYAHFPGILSRFPDFLTRVIQFTGLALIESIQAKLHYYEPFGNTEICLLQVAKTLLCNPDSSISTVFGLTATQLLEQSFEIKLSPSSTTVKCEKNAGEIIFNKPSPQPNCTEEQLWDLVSNVQIQPDSSITHPNYKPLASKEISERLQKLPTPLQQSYLSRQIRNYLYDIYFSGEQTPLTFSVDLGSVQPLNLKNDSKQGLNLTFYEQLHNSNQGKGYFDPGWRVLPNQKEGIVIVQKNGLTLHIEPSRHLSSEEKFPKIEEIVAIRLPRNRIESGFYVAVSNAGLIPDDLPTLEIYFNITPEGAIALMASVTQHLNAIHIPFAFKVLLDQEDYRRYDAGILQVEPCHYKAIQPLLTNIYQEALPHFHPQTPLFTKRLAPGLGLAEKPETEPKFGLNRCQLVAKALLAAQQTGDNSPENRMNLINQHFTQSGIDLSRPYLNSHADDIYIPLTCL